MKEYPQPDPAWIYYPMWQQVTTAHAALEELMQFMSTEACEEATVISDNPIDQILKKAHIAIIQAGDALPLKQEPQEDKSHTNSAAVMKLHESTGLTLVEPWLVCVSQLLSDEQIEAFKSRWNVTDVLVQEGNTFFELGQDMGQTQLPQVAQWLGGW